jgi:hypothetical protein
LHFLKQYETLHAEKLQNDSESDIAWGWRHMLTLKFINQQVKFSLKILVAGKK